MKKLFLLLAAMSCLVMNSYAADIAILFGDIDLYDDTDATPCAGVTWKASTLTLTLNNANIINNGLFIYSTHTVTIVVQGKNTLNVSQSIAIWNTYGALSIIGASNDAELTVISGTNSAINAIQGCSLGGGSYPLKLILQGADLGINHHTGSLTIANNVTLNIAATTEAAIYGSGSVTLAPGLCVTKPLGAEFVGGTLKLDGNDVTSAVTIEPYNLTEYNLWIKGTRVNDLNQSDIFRDKKVSYNPTTKILTLDNASISGGTDNSAIKTSISGLKIDVQGTCNLTSTSSTLPAVQCAATTTLTSSGANAKVSIKNSNNAAMINDGCSLSIDGGLYGMSVSLNGKSGIWGKNSGTLSIKNTTLNIGATTSGAIYGQNSINLNDCAITSPAGAKIYNGAIVDKSNQVVTSSVNIRKVEKYALSVAGTQVTDLNCSDILGDGGKVKYNPTTQTLTLYNATISSSTDVPISSNLGTLNLVCNGTNTLSYTGTSQYINGIDLVSTATIKTTQAKSSLTITGSRAGISMGTSNVLIDGNNFGLTLNLKGKQYGFYGSRGEGGGTTLTIKDANVNIDATTSGAINNLSSLTLTNVAVNEPTGCTFSTTNYALVKSGSVVKAAVKIGKPIEKYGLLIKGDQVTSENCNDILGDGGKVKYDNATKTLTLNNATIEYTEDVVAIYSDVTFKCIGSNTIYCTTNYNAIYSDAGSPTFVGPGKLTLISNQGTAMSIYCETLTVDGTTLLAKGNGKVATITGFNSLVMKNGAQISSKHTYDATSHKFYVKGTTTEAKDDIEIGMNSPGPDSYGITIAGVEVTDANYSDITGEGITGSVSYDPDTKTLTLDNAKIECADKSDALVVNNTESEVYIECIGDNSIVTTNESSTGIYIESATNLFIQGTGTLSVKAGCYGICLHAKTYSLSIKDCEMTLQSTGGYAAMRLNNGTLTIDNATMTAKGNGEWATIIGCAELNMNNGVVIRSNHTYDAENHIFLIQGTETEAMNDIIIGLKGTGIDEVTGEGLQVTGSRKILRDGQLLIIRNGQTYNAQGHQM